MLAVEEEEGVQAVSVSAVDFLAWVTFSGPSENGNAREGEFTTRCAMRVTDLTLDERCCTTENLVMYTTLDGDCYPVSFEQKMTLFFARGRDVLYEVLGYEIRISVPRFSLSHMVLLGYLAKTHLTLTNFTWRRSNTHLEQSCRCTSKMTARARGIKHLHISWDSISRCEAAIRWLE